MPKVGEPKHNKYIEYCAMECFWHGTAIYDMKWGAYLGHFFPICLYC
jgi:hypothetical protein